MPERDLAEEFLAQLLYSAAVAGIFQATVDGLQHALGDLEATRTVTGKLITLLLARTGPLRIARAEYERSAQEGFHMQQTDEHLILWPCDEARKKSTRKRNKKK